MRENMLRDTLHNCSEDVVRTDRQAEYGKGVLVGVVGTAMCTGTRDFEQAVAFIRPYLPKRLDPRCVPPAWLEAFGFEPVGK